MATDIHALLKTLTRQEKIGQLQQLPPFFFIKDLENEVSGAVRDLGITEDEVFLAGSVLGIRNAEEMIEVQKAYLEKSRHKIPLVIMADVIHGYETIFPIPLAMAAAFDPDVAKEAARIAATEAQSAGIHVTFAPMTDVSRDPRWGRVMEGFGEDVFLSSRYAEASVQGFQHDGIGKTGNVASCVKHFAGYGKVQAGRDYHAVEMSMNEWHNTYLPPYKAALDSGARLVMAAFNTFNGVPCSVSRFLMRDTLRDRLGFDGVTITDYDSLQQVIAHGAASDKKDAARLGMEAGIDIEMGSATYVRHLSTLIDEGVIDERLLDEAVLRILALKRDLGLFDDPFKGADPSREAEIVRSKAHLEASGRLAENASVLLKNDHGILPLGKEQHIVLVGPYATNRSTNGGWSWHGNTDLNETLEEAFIRHGASRLSVIDARTADALTHDNKKTIENADVVVLALGEHWRDSGEARSKTMISLDPGQLGLVRLVRSLSKKTVGLVFSGRPVVLSDIDALDAVMMVWFLGSRAADVIARTLLGRLGPSGKLPMTMPVNEGQIPIHHDHLMTGRPNLKDGNPYVTQYIDAPNDPLYPFGFGLTYGDVRITTVDVETGKADSTSPVTIRVNLENISKRATGDVIQIYVRKPVSVPVRPVRELKAFRRVHLDGMSKATEMFVLDADDFAWKSEDGTAIPDCGTYEIHVTTDNRTVVMKTIEMRCAS
jgi:beta-glucosidase